MGRRRAGRDIHGILLLDKPAGLSSNQALQKVRRLLDARKAGHTGNLDPLATGMLPVCLGEASKTAAYMLEASKTYSAVVALGEATSTGDSEGEVVRQRTVPDLDARQVENVLKEFTGPISQLPPMYSALKHQGQPLYRLARRGIEVERTPRDVVIHRLQLTRWQPPLLSLELLCSKGTYVRTLAEDICVRLGSCGHLRALRRLAVEPFPSVAMVSMEQVERAAISGREQEILLPLDAGLSAWPEHWLDDGAAEKFSHGNAVVANRAIGMVRVCGPGGRKLGLGEVRPGGMLYPKRVYVFEPDEA